MEAEFVDRREQRAVTVYNHRQMGASRCSIEMGKLLPPKWDSLVPLVIRL